MGANQLSEINQLFRHRREDQGLSQGALARRVGVNQKAVSTWETTRHVPNVSTYVAWARGLDVEFGMYVVIDGNFVSVSLTGDGTDQPESL